MKVWVVTLARDFEGAEVLGVGASVQAARRIAQSETKKKLRWNRDGDGMWSARLTSTSDYIATRWNVD